MPCNKEDSNSPFHEILFEYEEVVTALSGASSWRAIIAFFEGLSRLRGNVLFIEPKFRFQVIIADLDDNKFVDCAIASNTEFILTSDHHFDELISSGYKPRPIR